MIVILGIAGLNEFWNCSEYLDHKRYIVSCSSSFDSLRITSVRDGRFIAEIKSIPSSTTLSQGSAWTRNQYCASEAHHAAPSLIVRGAAYRSVPARLPTHAFASFRTRSSFPCADELIPPSRIRKAQTYLRSHGCGSPSSPSEGLGFATW